MAEEQFYTILTNVGKAKIANATLLNSNLTLKTLKVGDGNGTYYNPTEDQEDLKNTVHECAIGAIYIDKKNPNWIISETIIPGSVGGFTIREVGLFDAEGDMIAVGKYPETYKPVVANGASKDLNVRTIFEVSNAENVTLNLDPSVIIATKEDVNNLQEQIDENTAQLNDITQKFNGFKKQMISTEHKTYYVSTNGNDTTGDGSIEKPFRTIQKVQDLIPTILHHIYTISVLDGTYDGFTIFSHFGSGQIVIKSNSGNRDNVSISFANFNFCYNLVLLEGVTINTTTQIKISSYGCQRLEIKNCKLDSSSSYDGVIVEYTNCYLHDTLISNQETAIKSIVAGFILAQGCSGSGNGTALSAIYGGVIAKDNNTITATTQENSGLGGVIR